MHTEVERRAPPEAFFFFFEEAVQDFLNVSSEESENFGPISIEYWNLWYPSRLQEC